MDLNEARKKIDRVDSEILSLLQQRLKLAGDVAKSKAEKGKPIFIPSRESEIMNSLLSKRGEIPAKSLKGIFSEVIAMTRAAEKPLSIAYLGPKTTFTHAAALHKFGSTAELVAHDSISSVFNSVEKRESDYGVVPIENSIEGSVSHTLDMFLDSSLNIVAEIMLDVKHHLLSNSPLKGTKTVYSHPQAFAQCRTWLAKNLPNAELVEASSTARAAELASKNKESAAIASEMAAEEFSLKIVSKCIEDSSSNVTRFIVIGKEQNQKTGKDKTSIMFSVQHKPGALFSALQPFQKHGLNMTKIESRPAKKKLWEVVFFIDFEGFRSDETVKKALSDMGHHCLFVKVLGSYPEEVSVSW
ncbi:MAG: prephenate dehydratase [Candidatus Diapherotrites archaeon]|uniref:Bifunctional chorismate mutase/prephenate dehydratase n=1 Tax=Candidatus Iainarchaeum sp. TaxID=3101447 RepID=A0A938YZ14_9ARCH|nr:prephenate dehydratase [Candidatus Diapherotrites archaeon]